MTIITVELNDNTAKVLKERAERYGLPPDQFVAASIEDLIGQPDLDFQEVMDKVLSKNSTLYKRLS